MKKNILYFCLFMLFPFAIQAKLNRDDSKVIYEAAEQYFVDENYSAALPLYLRLDSIAKGNADINFKIGFCYLNTTYKTKSIPYLEEAIKNISDKYTGGNLKETTAPVSTYYYLAKAYHLNYEWDKAIAMYEKYISVIENDPKNAKDVEDTRHDIETCNYGKELVKTPLKVIITNLGPNVNSEYPDFSPVVSLDEQTLIFTSRRKGGATDEKLPNGQYLEDIYVSKFVNDLWEKAVSIGTTINTPKHEATINLSADGQKLLIYKDEAGGNIYVSELKGSEWGTPVLLEAPVNGPTWEPHACFTSDNRALYFISDRPGGFGGRDIYKCLRLPNGKWGPAQNLGEKINTKYDEDGIFIHPDGKQIYFSSKGHKSMGGFDIFTSKMDDENGYWTEPVNYGYPVNTTDDDVFLITSVDGKRAYFSSDKEGGYGEKDIYMIDFPEFLPRDITILVGKLINNSGSSIANNSIYIINTTTNDTLQVLNANSTTGKYGANLPIGSSYKTIYTVNGREFFSEVLDAPKGGGYNVIRREIPYDKAVQKKLATDDPATANKELANKNDDNWFGDKDDDDDDKVSNKEDNKDKNQKNNKESNKVKDKDKTKDKTDTKANDKTNSKQNDPVIANDKETNPKEGTETATLPCNIEELHFELFFKYNQKDSNNKRKEWKTFCDNLKNCLLANPDLVIEIESSASTVPTRKFRTNERLAAERANSGERKIINALVKRGIKKSQINFTKPFRSSVQGPEYQKDARTNKATYEQYQYIKIKASLKK
jgi:hypothetical protein